MTAPHHTPNKESSVTAQQTTMPTVDGEYRVLTERRGQGIDYYLTVVDPEGRSSDQKVYWTYSMTPYQVAETAVAQHLGHDDWRLGRATRTAPDRGYLVTVAD